jgi:hypothetical protein
MRGNKILMLSLSKYEDVGLVHRQAQDEETLCPLTRLAYARHPLPKERVFI